MAGDMSRRRIQLEVGNRFGWVELLESAPSVSGHSCWCAICYRCGRHFVVRADNLVSKKHPTRACKCLRDAKHSMFKFLMSKRSSVGPSVKKVMEKIAAVARVMLRRDMAVDEAGMRAHFHSSGPGNKRLSRCDVNLQAIRCNRKEMLKGAAAIVRYLL